VAIFIELQLQVVRVNLKHGSIPIANHPHQGKNASHPNLAGINDRYMPEIQQWSSRTELKRGNHKLVGIWPLLFFMHFPTEQFLRSASRSIFQPFLTPMLWIVRGRRASVAKSDAPDIRCAY
jgi:hypothetical protein